MKIKTHIVAIKGPGELVTAELTTWRTIGTCPTNTHGASGHHFELKVPSKRNVTKALRVIK